MAKKTKSNPETTKRSGASPIDPGQTATAPGTVLDQSTDRLLAQKQASWDTMRIIQSTWSDRERLLIARNADTYSQKTTRSHVTDSHISTLAFERQARVAAQLPTGSIHSLTAKDEKSAYLMNLVLNKYILPNANSQMDALSKLRMSGVYASVYGAQPILYDYRIDDEYIGPDFWLIPPRNFYPQPGKNSIRDSDWAMVATVVSVSYLEAVAKRDNTSWNKDALKQLIELAKVGKIPGRDIDSSKKSSIENARTSGRPPSDNGPAARVELVTKYERGEKGHWITFAPDYKEVDILRDIPNPHKNGRIPIVMRQCFPLIDSIWGLGDFERGITLQKAKDSLLNLYLDGVKLAIFPPLKIDVANVTYSSIVNQPGARWLMKDPNAVTPFESNPQALQSFQGTWQQLDTMLLNQFGTQGDMSSNKENSGNPAFGKTPAAIEQFKDKEAARDNWDRFQLEKCIEDLLEGMINLLAENQEKPINFHIFDSDMEQVEDMFGEQDDDTGKTAVPSKMMKKQGKAAVLTISKSMIAGNYKFLVDASSTMRQDEDAQVANLTQIITAYLQNPQLVDQYLAADKLQFHFGKAFKSLVYNSGINDPDTIVTDMQDEQQDQQQGGQQQQQPIDTSSLQDPHIRQIAEQLFNGGRQQQQQPPQAMAPQAPMQQGGTGMPTGNPMAQMQSQLAGMQQQGQAQQPQAQAAPQPSPQERIMESLNYKDAPEDIKRQMEQQAGFQPSQMPAQTDVNHLQALQLQQQKANLTPPPMTGGM